MHKQDFGEPEIDALESANKILWEKLDQETDLGVVLVAGAYFDYKMGECIRRYFLANEVAKKLLAPQGALGTFGAKLDCALCLRIIDELRHESLRKLARIRNVFAHDLNASFSDQSVRDKVADFADCYLGTLDRKVFDGFPMTSTTRGTFIFTAFNLSLDLSHRDVDVWMHVRQYSSMIAANFGRGTESQSP